MGFVITNGKRLILSELDEFNDVCDAIKYLNEKHWLNLEDIFLVCFCEKQTRSNRIDYFINSKILNKDETKKMYKNKHSIIGYQQPIIVSDSTIDYLSLSSIQKVSDNIILVDIIKNSKGEFVYV